MANFPTVPGGGNTPGFFTTSVQRPTRYRINEADGREDRIGGTIVSTAVDAGSSPTTLLRKGLVMGQNSSHKWLEASAATIVKSAAASVVSASGSSGFNFSAILALLYIEVNGKSCTVTFISAITTGAHVASEINAALVTAKLDDLAYASAVATSQVGLYTRHLGSEHTIQVTGGTANAAGYLVFAVTINRGADGVYGILIDAINLLSPLGSAQDSFADFDVKGLFDEDALYGMTVDARNVMTRCGARFRASI